MTPNEMSKRLIALESRRTTVSLDTEQNAVQAAYDRIFQSLCAALPAIDNSYLVRVSECASQIKGTRISSIEQMIELNNRFEAGTLTDADKAVLASVSNADLIATGTTTIEFIQRIANLDRDI